MEHAHEWCAIPTGGAVAAALARAKPAVDSLRDALEPDRQSYRHGHPVLFGCDTCGRIDAVPGQGYSTATLQFARRYILDRANAARPSKRNYVSAVLEQTTHGVNVYVFLI